MTSKSDSIGVTCTGLPHFADTFSQWNSCRKIIILGRMTENKCGYQMHIFITPFSTQHAPMWLCFSMVQPLSQPFRPKCTNRILQMHHQNPVVPPESGVHPQFALTAWWYVSDVDECTLGTGTCDQVCHNMFQMLMNVHRVQAPLTRCVMICFRCWWMCIGYRHLWPGVS